MQCPICRELMTNSSGNIYTCSDCDFTATEQQLKRIAQSTRLEIPRNLPCE